MSDETDFSMRAIAIEDWMIDLIDDDRTADPNVISRLVDLHWMYTAALVRWN